MLSDQFEEFEKDPTSSRKAILTTILAYHLREWLWKEHKASISQLLSTQDESKYNEYINKSCSNFKVIRHLCNGAKHYEYDPNKDGLKIVNSTKLKGGDFSPAAYDASFNIPVLIVDTGADKIKAIDLLSNAIEFYKSFCSQLGL